MADCQCPSHLPGLLPPRFYHSPCCPRWHPAFNPVSHFIEQPPHPDTPNLEEVLSARVPTRGHPVRDDSQQRHPCLDRSLVPTEVLRQERGGAQNSKRSSNDMRRMCEQRSRHSLWEKPRAPQTQTGTWRPPPTTTRALSAQGGRVFVSPFPVCLWRLTWQAMFNAMRATSGVPRVAGTDDCAPCCGMSVSRSQWPSPKPSTTALDRCRRKWWRGARAVRRRCTRRALPHGHRTLHLRGRGQPAWLSREGTWCRYSGIPWSSLPRRSKVADAPCSCAADGGPACGHACSLRVAYSRAGRRRAQDFVFTPLFMHSSSLTAAGGTVGGRACAFVPPVHAHGLLPRRRLPQVVPAHGA